MDQTSLIFAALLGLGLAASSGFNTFLPLLLLAGAARFQPYGIDPTLNEAFKWLSSDIALGTLLVATLIEVIGDKIPAVDHILDVVGTFARPVAGALAAASVFEGADPAVAVVAGLIIGSPTAFTFHAAKAGTRVASSATTMGVGNPVLSLLEDLFAVVLTVVSLLAPILVPLLLVVGLFATWRICKAVRRRRQSLPTP